MKCFLLYLILALLLSGNAYSLYRIYQLQHDMNEQSKILLLHTGMLAKTTAVSIALVENAVKESEKKEVEKKDNSIMKKFREDM